MISRRSLIKGTLHRARHDGIITTPLLNIYLGQAQDLSLPMDAIPVRDNLPSGGKRISRMGPPLGF